MSVHKVRHCEHFYEVKPAISIAYLADNEIAEPVLDEVKNLAPSLLRLRLATAPLLAMTRLLILYRRTLFSSSSSKSEFVMITCKIVQHGSAGYRETVVLRDKLLRKPLGLRFKRAELEAETDSHHLACYRNGRLAACLVLKPERDGKVRMRQLAVAEHCQHEGIGTELVAYAESVATGLGYTEMVLHARETVVLFYERLGYEKAGERFVEVTIPHFFMSKHLPGSEEQQDEP